MILASASPQRRRILEEAGFIFEICPSDIPENMDSKQDPETNVCRLAQEKALALQDNYPREIIVAADSIVVSPSGSILMKAKNEEEARKMLEDRRGRSERAITGYCILTPEGMHTDVEVSLVHYTDFSDEILEKVLESGEWKGVAGALRIEGEWSQHTIDHFGGDKNNIFGFPSRAIQAIKEIL